VRRPERITVVYPVIQDHAWGIFPDIISIPKPMNVNHSSMVVARETRTTLSRWQVAKQIVKVDFYANPFLL